jgi:hypothetical protein
MYASTSLRITSINSALVCIEPFVFWQKCRVDVKNFASICDNADTLAKKVLKQEHILYPEAIKKVLQK